MLSNIEKGFFLKLYNRGGYVLDFTTSDFDVFTMQSVGIPLCETYQLSKGKSLTSYVNEASDKDISKLLFDLLDYYEANYGPEYDPDQAENFSTFAHEKQMRSVYLKCRSIADREKELNTPLTAAAEYLIDAFSSEYMTGQIELLMKMRTENPTDAIGKSKELVESCCKTILESQGIAYDKNWNMARLSKETAKALGVDVDNTHDTSPEGPIVKKILGSLQGLVLGVAEFRNSFGSGHGKSASFQELPVRHAKLAVGSAVTLVEYYWETYEWKKSLGVLK